VVVQIGADMAKTGRVVLLISVLLTLVVACRNSGPKLDDRVLQLSITYSTDGPRSAQMTGGRGAASPQHTVECRIASGDKPIIGRATSDPFGAFTMELDYRDLPKRPPTVDDYDSFNEIIE